MGKGSNFDLIGKVTLFASIVLMTTSSFANAISESTRQHLENLEQNLSRMMADPTTRPRAIEQVQSEIDRIKREYKLDGASPNADIENSNKQSPPRGGSWTYSNAVYRMAYGIGWVYFFADEPGNERRFQAKSYASRMAWNNSEAKYSDYKEAFTKLFFFAKSPFNLNLNRAAAVEWAASMADRMNLAQTIQYLKQKEDEKRQRREAEWRSFQRKLELEREERQRERDRAAWRQSLRCSDYLRGKSRFPYR